MTITNIFSGLLLSLVLLVSCKNAGHRKADEAGETQAYVKSFPVKDGWAYSIFIGSKEYIRQTSVPCISGNIPFTTDSQATKAGNLVLSKLKAHQGPTLTMKELEDNHLLPAKEATTQQ